MTATLSAVPADRRERDASVRMDQTMSRVAALLDRRALLDERCDPRSEAGPIEAIHRARLQQVVADLLAHLPAREAQVLRWRFGLAGEHDHKLREIGARIGLSRERVRQIERDAIQRLRGLAELRAVHDEPDECSSWSPTREAPGEAR